ncbi:MAG: hypothetical protein DRJ28_08385 [Actinobacteria bacterium]|nr:MAG: hypothetical protein DRJ28_08385 [Actinomycetota bacterium]
MRGVDPEHGNDLRPRRRAIVARYITFGATEMGSASRCESRTEVTWRQLALLNWGDRHDRDPIGFPEPTPSTLFLGSFPTEDADFDRCHQSEHIGLIGQPCESRQ